MKRRHFLQTGVFAGTIALGTQLAVESPAEAAGGVKSRFFQGSLTGGSLDGYALQIGVAAARTRGTATPPDGEGSLDIVPMSGMLLGNNLSLAIFSAAREGDAVEIGTLTGTLRGKTLKGTYTLTAGGKGTFATKLITGNKKSMKKLSGVYEGQVNFLDAYATGWSGVATVKSNGTWELGQVKSPDGEPLAVRFAGIYVIPNGQRGGESTPVLAMLLPRTNKGVRGLALCDCSCCDGNDKDGDGKGDNLDDSDNDGIPDRDDPDWDNDGNPDDVDPDDDNDGKPDDQDPEPYTDAEREKERREWEASLQSAMAAINAARSTQNYFNLVYPPMYPGGPSIIVTARKN